MSQAALHDADTHDADPAASAVGGTGQPEVTEASAKRRSEKRQFSRISSRTGLVILLFTVLGLALRVLQLTRPGHLLGVTEYDDGVYLGSAIRLVYGVVPYRDFILVQPPGLILLMTPVAALGKITGTAWAMGIGRLLTAAAGAASVTLAGLLVRRRGMLAVVITCGIMAVYPEAIQASKTVLQEPWLVLACLAGLLALFDDEHITDSKKRLAWGGVAFGFAGAIKLWAIFPIIVIVLLCARRPRKAAVYVGGVAAGFGVPVLPFAALAPSSFYHGVFVAQLVRVDDARTSLTTRLKDLSGLVSGSHGTVLLVSVVIVLLVVAACVGACVVTRRLPSPLEWFALVTAGLVLLSFLWPVDFYYHYACFFAPFLALAVALPVARLVTGLAESSGQRSGGFRLDMAGLGAAVLVIAVMFVSQAHSLATERGVTDPTSAPNVIPKGACVLTDQVSFTIAADRFISSVPGCPQIVDGDGTDLDLSRGRNGVSGAAMTAAVRNLWDDAFRKAQYVWLSSGLHGVETRRIAWTPSLRNYFAQNFQRIPGHGRIYKRIGPGT
ncbi:MAG TPA: glycosyltransferase 87 family protein [Streptosporangiaceae bacterium]